jgi:hypothetical protein
MRLPGIKRARLGRASETAEHHIFIRRKSILRAAPQLDGTINKFLNVVCAQVLLHREYHHVGSIGGLRLPPRKRHQLRLHGSVR